tara:strand:- start:8 stop:271 length:264 start_codon:yes stop_codon:yes gene_type:complete
MFVPLLINTYLKMNLEVSSIRYFETNRGIGYKAKTNLKGVQILNDGQGGETYLETQTPKRENKELYELSEWDLELLLIAWENKVNSK